MTSVEKTVSDALGRGKKLLGMMVYWKGLTDVRIARPLWRQGLDVAGVKDAVTVDPGNDALLSSACDFAVRRQPRGERVTLQLTTKGQEAVYRVMVPRRLPDGRASTIEEATVSVDCYADGAKPIVTYLVTDPHPDRDRVIADVVEWYGELQNYVFTDEVSKALVEIMKYLNAASMRAGVYFVQASNFDKLHAVKRFIESSTTAHVTAWNIKGDDENAAEARYSAREHLTTRLDDVVAKVTKFTESISVEKAIARSVNARVKLFRELEAEVDLWSDVLGEYTEQLSTTIAKAKETLLGAYLGISEDDAPTDEVAA